MCCLGWSWRQSWNWRCKSKCYFRLLEPRKFYKEAEFSLEEGTKCYGPRVLEARALVVTLILRPTSPVAAVFHGMGGAPGDRVQGACRSAQRTVDPLAPSAANIVKVRSGCFIKWTNRTEVLYYSVCKMGLPFLSWQSK